MKGMIELYYDLPYLAAYLEASGTNISENQLKEEIDGFLKEAVLHHVEENKFLILGVLNTLLEGKEIVEGSNTLFRKLPTIATDLYFDTDKESLEDCSEYLAQRETFSMQNWGKTGRRGEQRLFRTTAAALFEQEKESENQADDESLPLVFLDFDGVLNTDWHFAELKGKGLPFKDKYGPLFDPEAVKNLKKIIDDTDAQIVVSSSWRYMGLEDLQGMWHDRGLPGKIVGITPLHTDDDKLLVTDLSELDDITAARRASVDGLGVTDLSELDVITADMFCSRRVNEIKVYFEEVLCVDATTQRYVILDDLKDVLPEQEEHFIRIDPIVGITEEDAEMAIEILNC